MKDSRKAFEKWWTEVENYSLRGERFDTPHEAAEAAARAAWAAWATWAEAEAVWAAKVAWQASEQRIVEILDSEEAIKTIAKAIMPDWFVTGKDEELVSNFSGQTYLYRNIAYKHAKNAISAIKQILEGA